MFDSNNQINVQNNITNNQINFNDYRNWLYDSTQNNGRDYEYLQENNSSQLYYEDIGGNGLKRIMDKKQNKKSKSKIPGNYKTKTYYVYDTNSEEQISERRDHCTYFHQFHENSSLPPRFYKANKKLVNSSLKDSDQHHYL